MKLIKYSLVGLILFFSPLLQKSSELKANSLTYTLTLNHIERQLYERFIVASTIYMEARGEGTEGMKAVAAVIKQRAINGNDPLSVVCLKSYQFSCWNAYIGTEPSFYEAWAPLVSDNIIEQRAAKAAMDIAFNIQNLDTSFYGFVDHYHATRIKPYWSRGLTPDFVLGNHAFYRLSTVDQDH